MVCGCLPCNYSTSYDQAGCSVVDIWQAICQNVLMIVGVASSVLYYTIDYIGLYVSKLKWEWLTIGTLKCLGLSFGVGSSNSIKLYSQLPQYYFWHKLHIIIPARPRGISY